MNKWKRKAIALARLAEDQRGKPEGEVARQKLLQILNRYPQAREYEPIKVFTLRDIAWMRRRGISTAGKWTGTNFADAIRLMVEDYQQRMASYKPPLPEKVK